MAGVKLEVKALASFLNVGSIKVNVNSETKVPSVQCNGTSVSGLMSIAAFLARFAGKANLVGVDSKTQAVIGQWLEYRVIEVDRCHGEKDETTVMKELDSYLATRTYMTGQQFSLADVLLYYGLHSKIIRLSYQEKEKYINLSRWFNHVQRLPNVRQHFTEIPFSLNKLYVGVAFH